MGPNTLLKFYSVKKSSAKEVYPICHHVLGCHIVIMCRSYASVDLNLANLRVRHQQKLTRSCYTYDRCNWLNADSLSEVVVILYNLNPLLNCPFCIREFRIYPAISCRMNSCSVSFMLFGALN
jgi:hypothetical protein